MSVVLGLSALSGCGSDTKSSNADPSTSTAQFNYTMVGLDFAGVDPDRPDHCQPQTDGTPGDFRPCFWPVRVKPEGDAPDNPILNPITNLSDGQKTAAWPYEPGTSPDGFHKDGDHLKVVCTSETGGELFAGIAVVPDQLNLSAAANLPVATLGKEVVVFGRAKWLQPLPGQPDLSVLPDCPKPPVG